MEHDIGWAVAQMLDGKNVRRRGWNGNGMWLRFIGATTWTVRPQLPDGVDTLHSFIGMKTVQDGLIPWLCSQTDLLSADWEIAA